MNVPFFVFLNTSDQWNKAFSYSIFFLDVSEDSAQRLSLAPSITLLLIVSPTPRHV